MKDQNGGRSVYFYSFFNLGSRWGGWLTTPLTALPHGITRCPLYRRLGGDQARSGKAIGPYCKFVHVSVVRLRLKCDGTRVETRFRLSAKRTSPFKWTGASVQSTTGSRGVRISGSNAGYTMLRSSVKSTGYPLHSPVSPSLPLPCVAVCNHISTGSTAAWTPTENPNIKTQILLLLSMSGPIHGQYLALDHYHFQSHSASSVVLQLPTQPGGTQTAIK